MNAAVDKSDFLTPKDILRVRQVVNIVQGDCECGLGMEILVTEKNSEGLVGRYIIKNGKIKLIDGIAKYIGKTIVVRSPLYCIENGNNFCATCVGKKITKISRTR